MNPPHHSGMVMTTLRLLPLALCFLLFPTHAHSQLVNGRLVSSIDTWERFDTAGVSKMFGRGFQSVMLDVVQSSFSLHTHLQGAVNLQKNLEETPDFRAWYLYGMWKGIGGVMDLSFGRVPYFAGVGTGTLDGALTTLHIADDAVRLTVYGGAPVPAGLAVDRWKPLASNHTVGGQFATTAVEGMRIALSYIQRKRELPSYIGIRTDSLFNPVPTLIEPEPVQERTAGLDASYQTGALRVYGRTDYNVDDEKAQRIRGFLRYDLSSRLAVSGEFVYRRPRVPGGSFFALFPASTIEEGEVGCDYAVSTPWSLFARGALVRYDGEQSFRYTAGVAHRYLYLSYRGNSGCAGELNSVSLQGAYPLLERMLVPNASLTYTSYRLSDQAATATALAAALGATFRPASMVSLDVQGQWLQNRIFKNDVRLFARLTFWFTEQLHIL